MTQYARPESMITDQGWEPYGAASEPEAMDEVTPDDNDYMYNTDTGENFDVQLSEVTDPQNNVNHVLKFRWMAVRDSTPPEKGGFALYCDGTMIRLIYDNDTLPTSWTTEQVTLTTAEADNITDYSKLSCRGNATTLGSNEEMRISWIEFSCDDAPAAGGGAKNMQLMGVG